MTVSEKEQEPMLLVDTHGRVLRLTLNRPQRRNALHPVQLRQLTEVVRDASSDDEILVMTIDGAGTAAFSAGFDIKVLAERGAGSPPPSVSLFEAIAALEVCPKITIALIQGYCFGAGFDLAMACDFRIGTPNARFAVPAVRLGTVYEPRSIDRIQRLLGPIVAKELFVTGRELDAPRAAAVGILQDVVAPDALDAALEHWIPSSSEAAEGHKLIIDALAAAPERSTDFWEPLDSLRQRSLESRQRQAAVEEFARRESGIPRGGRA